MRHYWQIEGGWPSFHCCRNIGRDPTKHGQHTIAHEKNKGNSKGGEWTRCFWHGVACLKTRAALVVTTVDIDCIVCTFVVALVDGVALSLSFFLQAG